MINTYISKPNNVFALLILVTQILTNNAMENGPHSDAYYSEILLSIAQKANTLAPNTRFKRKQSSKSDDSDTETNMHEDMYKITCPACGQVQMSKDLSALKSNFKRHVLIHIKNEDTTVACVYEEIMRLQKCGHCDKQPSFEEIPSRNVGVTIMSHMATYHKSVKDLLNNFCGMPLNNYFDSIELPLHLPKKSKTKKRSNVKNRSHSSKIKCPVCLEYKYANREHDLKYHFKIHLFGHVLTNEQGSHHIVDEYIDELKNTCTNTLNAKKCEHCQKSFNNDIKLPMIAHILSKHTESNKINSYFVSYCKKSFQAYFDAKKEDLQDEDED